MYIDEKRVRAVSGVIAAMQEQEGLNFFSSRVGDRDVVESDVYPAIGHPAAIDFFFFVCVHQFGFWLADERGYTEPLVGTVDGKPAKGSDLLFRVCMRALGADATVFALERLADATEATCQSLFSDDHGPIAFRDMDERVRLTRAYGQSMVRFGVTPRAIVTASNRSSEPLRGFLAALEHIVGFSGDPLQKKSLLLAMALANRPEKFLLATDERNWRPIVDYHVMRVALRLGLVVLEGEDTDKIIARAWVDADVESRLRGMVGQATYAVQRRSMRSLSMLDHALWSARTYCPEMTYPDCSSCVFKNVCGRHVDLFQPVFATTNY